METKDAKRNFERLFTAYNSGRLGRLRHWHFKLIFSKILERIARKRQTSYRRRVNLPWGEKINVLCPDTTSLEISRFGFYEEGLTRMVLEYVKPGMTFLDVSAHIGYYTLLAAWLVGDRGPFLRTYPGTFELLQANAGLKPNVRLNMVAVSSESGYIGFNDYGQGLMGHNSKFIAKLDNTTLEKTRKIEYEVPATTIDEYVSHNGVFPDFVKIDAESSEYDVVQGMEETLRRNHPVISVEVGDMDIDGVIPCRDLVIDLISKGYDAYEFSGGQVVKHQLKEHYGYDNILFLPSRQIVTSCGSLMASAPLIFGR